MSQTNDIWDLIAPYLADENLELDDLELAGHGRGRTLRVTVDGEDLDLDRLSELSRALSRLLDDEPGLQEQYQLEVSSPGLERNLRRPRHYEKSVGREVVAKVTANGNKKTKRGVLTTAGERGFILESEDGPMEISYEDVVSAKTVFRWDKAPKPGH